LFLYSFKAKLGTPIESATFGLQPLKVILNMWGDEFLIWNFKVFYMALIHKMVSADFFEKN
jgi:hypothetical protein